VIADVVAEFASETAPITEQSGVIAHAKATLVAAAASRGKPVDEAGYLAALAAVDGDDGSLARRYADGDVVASRCEAASAVADLAAERLRQDGAKPSDLDYEQRYIAEVEHVGRSFGLPYGGRA
jgi:hypothetical protein